MEVQVRNIGWNNYDLSILFLQLYVQEKPKARKLEAIKHISPEELLRNQQELFARARNNLTKSQEVLALFLCGSFICKRLISQFF